MNGSRPKLRMSALLLVTLAMSSGSAARAGDEKDTGIPTCDKKIGTLSVVEPEQKWWTQYNLESPEALIKVLVAECKCFTLVDRGKGLAAAQKEWARTSARAR
jgi:hypothetical protein